MKMKWVKVTKSLYEAVSITGHGLTFADRVDFLLRDSNDKVMQLKAESRESAKWIADLKEEIVDLKSDLKASEMTCKELREMRKESIKEAQKGRIELITGISFMLISMGILVYVLLLLAD